MTKMTILKGKQTRMGEKMKMEIHKMLFIGVTTKKSIVNHIFPEWIKMLGSDLLLECIDIPMNSAEEDYGFYANKIKTDASILGALVTTHKSSLYKSAKDFFDELAESSVKFGEIGCVYKRNTRMIGEATDVLTIKHAFENICLAHQGSPNTSSDICILGCGGAGVALAYVLLSNQSQFTGEVIMTDAKTERVKDAKNSLQQYDTKNRLIIQVVEDMSKNDAVVESLRESSFVVNATGMGKDIPGSPIFTKTLFPKGGCVWEYNYRGELGFYRLAMSQKEGQQLSVFDGFDYFLYGWSTVISRVLNITINDELFMRLRDVAIKIYEAYSE